MATHQYIGARYVPYYYENSLDPTSTEWEPNVNYEALTVVTLPNQHSYISKKAVPDSIGSPALNAEYWLDTGSDNAYIQALQDQIDAITADLADFQGNIILVTDSYGGLYPVPGTTFPDHMRNFAGWDSTKLQTVIVSGGGFIRDTGNGTFLSNLTSYVAGLTDEDKNAVKIVLVAAGRNDWTETESDILNAIGAFTAYCKTEFKNNIDIKLAFLANGTNSGNGTRVQQLNVYNAFKNCAKVGAHYIAGSEAILKNSDCMANDFVHPSELGRQYIAMYLLQGLFQGSCCVNYPPKTVNFTLVSQCSGALSAASIKESVYNGMTRITCEPIGQLDMDYGFFTISADNPAGKVIGSIGSGYVQYPYEDVYLPQDQCVYQYYNADQSINPAIMSDLAFKLRINSDGEIRVFAYGKTGHALARIIFLGNSDVTLPSVYC